ncbi:hypothetical protein LEP1GSC116_4800 [Leptospira interrogans serovar Icterohaemorrhagiae str. Verdun HP]|uniref:Uncharacterized protein n=6 Tax=Leptospira interrogans TaxID=173 RepID=M3IDB8_LEPIR|nr:hypothetical protein LEP1GSC148_3088 [Leptospira interrogans serovar Canicola str. LT1962]EMG13331.1 hypothetical protein LEP1GSC151_4397 [Leptospira interrogans serovar Grippotyphosa str. LT2186]EMG20102.1 hypothetical protein LEP1GSC150_4945 [Leptospira interrogans serovar Copenhageni str. LT2050]EMM83117.1 hypothetical protein LEP1GSC037_2358 [Leptospira interrogans str. 2006001854]EMM93962.1 hypothetical protein LEP1GSC158_4545 [Leptospira interrogans serovar Zanoni str. LT2156]EMO07278
MSKFRILPKEGLYILLEISKIACALTCGFSEFNSSWTCSNGISFFLLEPVTFQVSAVPHNSIE